MVPFTFLSGVPHGRSNFSYSVAEFTQQFFFGNISAGTLDSLDLLHNGKESRNGRVSKRGELSLLFVELQNIFVCVCFFRNFVIVLIMYLCVTAIGLFFFLLCIFFYYCSALAANKDRPT